MNSLKEYKPAIYGPRTLTQTQQKELTRFNFKLALKLYFSNQFSLVYTVTNFFLPFFLCLIGSCINPNGAIVVIVIGLTSSFYTVFNQLAMVLGQILSRRVIKEIRNSLFPAHNSCSSIRGYLVNGSLIVGTIYGLIMTCLFMLSAGLYTHFIPIYKNLYLATDFAWLLVTSLLPTIFLVYINDVLLVEVFLNYGNLKSIIILLLQYVVRLILVSLFALNINAGILGIGIGMMFSSIFDLFVDMLLISYKTNIFKIDKVLFRQNIKQDFKISWIFIFRSLFGYITKSVLILITGLVTVSSSSESYATMIMARIIWFNIIFTCSWFADACVLQTALYKLMYWHDRIFPLNYATLMRFNLVLGVIVEFFTLIGFGFLVPEIAGCYVQHIPLEPNNMAIESFKLATKWSINSMINIPLSNIGSNVSTYIQGGSYTMIFLGIYVFLGSIGKIGTLTPYSTAHPRKTDIYGSYIAPPLTMITTIISITLTKHNSSGFWSYLQGFTCPLIFIGLISFIIGMCDAKIYLKYVKSPVWLQRFNSYQSTNPIIYRKWHFGESLRKQLSSL